MEPSVQSPTSSAPGPGHASATGHPEVQVGPSATPEASSPVTGGSGPLALLRALLAIVIVGLGVAGLVHLRERRASLPPPPLVAPVGAPIDSAPGMALVQGSSLDDPAFESNAFRDPEFEALEAARLRAEGMPDFLVEVEQLLGRGTTGASGPSAGSGAPRAAPSGPASHGAGGHTNPARATQVSTVRHDGETYQVVHFEQLADFEAPLAGLRPTGSAVERARSIPQAVRSLTDQRIAVEGYMLPYQTEGDRVSMFYLTRTVPGCCFGVMPRINEVIEVHLARPARVVDTSTPVLVTGTLQVQEVIDEFNTLICLYTFAGDGVLDPGRLR